MGFSRPQLEEQLWAWVQEQFEFERSTALQKPVPWLRAPEGGAQTRPERTGVGLLTETFRTAGQSKARVFWVGWSRGDSKCRL